MSVLVPGLIESIQVEILHIGVAEHIQPGLHLLRHGADVALRALSQAVIQILEPLDPAVQVSLYCFQQVDSLSHILYRCHQAHVCIGRGATASINRVIPRLGNVREAVLALESLIQFGLGSLAHGKW